MGPAFLPWHRQFVRMFEQQLQAIEPSVTIPYWDWAVDNAPDAYLWSDDFMGGNGDPSADYAVTTGPFRQERWQINVFDYSDTRQFPSLVRDFGAGHLAPTLPTPEDVEVALSIPVYDAAPWNTMIPTGRSFRNALEGWQDCVDETCDPVDGMAPTCTGPHNLHNGVHLWIAGEFAFAFQNGDEDAQATPAPTPPPDDDLLGTMAAATSLNDPVFWLHHANIDRIWNEWMRRHGEIYEPVSGGPLGHNIDDAMWPYMHVGMTVTPRMMLSSRALGYIYDTEV
jgi:tyrosinase